MRCKNYAYTYKRIGKGEKAHKSLGLDFPFWVSDIPKINLIPKVDAEYNDSFVLILKGDGSMENSVKSC